MSEKELSGKAVSHEECLSLLGFDICSPVSGSMLPLIRAQKDHALFIPITGRLRRYDVVLYRRGSQAVMHRIIRLLPDGYWIRGDNSIEGEFVKEAQIIGVMKGLYRGNTYIPATHPFYRCYFRIWTASYPLLFLFKKGKAWIRKFVKILN